MNPANGSNGVSDYVRNRDFAKADTKCHENFPFVRFFKIKVPNVVGYLKALSVHYDIECYITLVAFIESVQRKRTKSIKSREVNPDHSASCGPTAEFVKVPGDRE
ncbi:UNVERIFIED_CONTAM: hypothetical protein NCL1_43004 [Trichonephila clavipes]